MNASTPRAFDFLLTLWEGGGNVPPTIALVRRLVARGHHVRVMSDECNRREAQDAGAEFVPWTTAPNRPDKSLATEVLRDWEASTPAGSIGLLLDRIMCGPAARYAEDVRKELDRRPADVVVTSDLILGPMVAAEAARVSLAVLTANIPTFPVDGLPPFGPGLLPARCAEEEATHAAIALESEAMIDRGLPVLNAARAAFGLAPLAHVSEQVRVANRILVGTSEAFDFRPARLPQNLRYVGPMLDDPAWVEPWSSSWSESAGEPLVLVAFSTTWQAQHDTLRNTIDALADLPVRALVTTGPSLDTDDFPAPANVILCQSAPHSLVLADASAVVTHGGHGTVIRALAAGVPLLVLPMGRDQEDNAARVEFHGAGLRLCRTAAPAEIRAAIARLLDEPAFRISAAALGRQIVADARECRVIGELESLASECGSATPGEPTIATGPPQPRHGSRVIASPEKMAPMSDRDWTKRRWLGTVLVVILFLLAGATAVRARRSDPVERGRYLVTIMTCNDCHTPWIPGSDGPQPDLTRLLSGHPADLKVDLPKQLDSPWEWVGTGSNTAFAGPWGGELRRESHAGRADRNGDLDRPRSKTRSRSRYLPRATARLLARTRRSPGDGPDERRPLNRREMARRGDPVIGQSRWGDSCDTGAWPGTRPLERHPCQRRHASALGQRGLFRRAYRLGGAAPGFLFLQRKAGNGGTSPSDGSARRSSGVSFRPPSGIDEGLRAWRGNW